MLILVLIGALMVAVTVVLHAVGTTAWVRHLVRRHSSSDGSWRPASIYWVMISTALVMLLLHIAEVVLWATAYRTFVPDELESFEEATYFSFVTFTSLGYGDITLSSKWRLLSGIEALNGILLAGFSTALLFGVLARAWDAKKEA